jgi:hypothetical protein
VLVRNEPPPLLFIGQSTSTRKSETPRGWTLRPMDKHHVEAQDQPTLGWFSRSQVGATQGVLPRGGCPVGP